MAKTSNTNVGKPGKAKPNVAITSGPRPQTAAQLRAVKATARAHHMAARGAQGSRPELSGCAADYLDVLIDPFDVNRHSACIPTFPCGNSRKLTTFVRGAFPTNTSTGNFAITLDPGNGAANDLQCVEYWSDPSHVGGGNTLPWLSGTGTSAGNSNSPYPTTMFGIDEGDAQVRLVAAGLRIRYDDAALYAGGVVAPIRHPDNEEVNTYTLEEVLAFGFPEPNLKAAKWLSVAYVPTKATDLNFNSDVGSYTAPCMGIIGTANTMSSNKTLRFEAVMHYEVIGSNIRGKTSMLADVLGLQAVLNYALTHAMQRDSVTRATKGVEKILAEGSSTGSKGDSAMHLELKTLASTVGNALAEEARASLARGVGNVAQAALAAAGMQPGNHRALHVELRR